MTSEEINNHPENNDIKRILLEARCAGIDSVNLLSQLPTPSIEKLSAIENAPDQGNQMKSSIPTTVETESSDEVDATEVVDQLDTGYVSSQASTVPADSAAVSPTSSISPSFTPFVYEGVKGGDSQYVGATRSSVASMNLDTEEVDELEGEDDEVASIESEEEYGQRFISPRKRFLDSVSFRSTSSSQFDKSPANISTSNMSKPKHHQGGLLHHQRLPQLLESNPTSSDAPTLLIPNSPIAQAQTPGFASLREIIQAENQQEGFIENRDSVRPVLDEGTEKDPTMINVAPSSSRRRKSSHPHKANPKVKFTPEEDQKILEGLQRFNNDIEQIITAYNLNRTVKQVQDRLKRIQKANGPSVTKKRKLSNSSGPNLSHPGSPCINHQLSPQMVHASLASRSDIFAPFAHQNPLLDPSQIQPPSPYLRSGQRSPTSFRAPHPHVTFDPSTYPLPNHYPPQNQPPGYIPPNHYVHPHQMYPSHPPSPYQSHIQQHNPYQYGNYILSSAAMHPNTTMPRRTPSFNNSMESTSSNSQPAKPNPAVKPISSYFPPLPKSSKSSSSQNSTEPKPKSPMADPADDAQPSTSQPGPTMHSQSMPVVADPALPSPRISRHSAPTHSSQSDDYRKFLEENQLLKQNIDMLTRELDLTRAQFQTECAKYNDTITVMEKDYSQLESEAQLLKKEMESYQTNLQEREIKVRQVLIEFLESEAKQKCREDRRRVNENSLRLASVHYERVGVDFKETWREGYAFTELGDKLRLIQSEREEIERQKKLISNRKRHLNKGTNFDLDLVQTLDEVPKDVVEEAHDVCEQEEIFKLRLNTLKKEENDILAQLQALKVEKDLHMREVRRIRDEDNSRFTCQRTLNDRYFLLQLIGKGGFSEVFKAYDLQELRVVACKIHALNENWSENRKANYVKHSLREYRIHKKLKHPRIVRLYDVFEIDQSSFCTVLEYVEGSTDLDQYVHSRGGPDGCLPEREAKSIVVQIFSALKYLNELPQPVIHYDLKPGNILFYRGRIKLTDFGLSKIIDLQENEMEQTREIELTSQGAGTYWYLPAECFSTPSGNQEGPMISSKVDVYSVGVIFYQLLYGRKPFHHGRHPQAVVANHLSKDSQTLDFPPKPIVSQETKDFIKRCLEYHKERRPDVLTVCQDPYLNPYFAEKGLVSAKNQRKSNGTFAVPTSVPQTANSSMSVVGGLVGTVSN